MSEYNDGYYTDRVTKFASVADLLAGSGTPTPSSTAGAMRSWE
jgi:hypothetical protein